MQCTEVCCRRVQQHNKQKENYGKPRIEDVVYTLCINCEKTCCNKDIEERTQDTFEQNAPVKKGQITETVQQGNPNLPLAHIGNKVGGYGQPCKQ